MRDEHFILLCCFAKLTMSHLWLQKTSIYHCLFRFSSSPTLTMAYNREWDRGKDSWAHSNQWSTQDSRTTVRGREEDYTGDGKRRKFNNGVRDVLFQPFCITSSDNSRVTTVPETLRIFLHTDLLTADRTIGLTTMAKRTGLGQVALRVQSRNVWYLPSRVLTLSSLVWIQTSQRPMSVDSYVLEYCYTHD